MKHNLNSVLKCSGPRAFQNSNFSSPRNTLQQRLSPLAHKLFNKKHHAYYDESTCKDYCPKRNPLGSVRSSFAGLYSYWYQCLHKIPIVYLSVPWYHRLFSGRPSTHGEVEQHLHHRLIFSLFQLSVKWFIFFLCFSLLAPLQYSLGHDLLGVLATLTPTLALTLSSFEPEHDLFTVIYSGLTHFLTC